MEQIRQADSHPEETVAAKMMPYKSTKAIFGIVTGVLQGNTLAPNLFVICLDYKLRISIANTPH